MQGIVFGNRRIGYKDLPKIACTSIKNKIYEIQKGKPFSFEEERKWIHDYYWSRKKNIDGCEFRFVVVRDPVKRFLSAYSNRVTFHKECSKKYLQEKCPDLVDLVPNYSPSVHEFIKSFDIYKKIKSIDWHTKPILEHGVNDLSYFTQVYRIEDIKNLEKDISKIIDKDFTLGREQTGGIKVSLSNLEKNEIEFLIDYYEDDYRTLGGVYTKDRVWFDWKQSRSKV